MAGGILLIDKPQGWTSFDVVNRVRRIAVAAGLNTTGRKRYPVGHTGTLDPLATGLLVLLLGAYTKKAMTLGKLDKVYDAEIRLGEISNTGDAEGEKTNVSDRVPTRNEVLAALRQFTGDIMQRPHPFSAVKVGGQRSYALARAGRAPDLAPRPVRIDALMLGKYEYPRLSFTTKVSSGTYIRSLAEDIGECLGTGAYVTALRRTMVGEFSVADAVPVDGLDPDTMAARLLQM